MFIIEYGEKTIGPLTGAQVKTMAQQRKLHREMRIRKHPDGAWQPIASVAGLEFQVAAVPLDPPGKPIDPPDTSASDGPIGTPPPRPAAPSPQVSVSAVSAVSVQISAADPPQLKVPIRPKPLAPLPAELPKAKPKQELIVSPTADQGEVLGELVDESRDDRQVACPFCGESIKRVARKCKHCGEYLDQRLRAEHAAAVGTTVNVMNHNAAHATVAAPPMPFWNPNVAVMLSFFWPGLGQLYRGQVAAGIVWMFCTLLGYLFFILPGIVLHVCCMVAAGTGDPYRPEG